MTSFTFKERDDTTQYGQPALDFEVVKYSWSVFGGPKKATVIARGPDSDLWNLLWMIRNPVRIRSDKGDFVWWGILGELDMIVRTERALQDPTINTKARVGVSMDSFYNRVKVAYTELNAGDDSIGDRVDTAWADSDESQDEYGIKELLWTKDNATATFAAQARDRKLSQVKYPVPTLQTYKGSRESQAKITCVGLWETLGWYLSLIHISEPTRPY